MFRAGPPFTATDLRLGLLAELPGHWVGHGFELIAQPSTSNEPPFVLELNATKETIEMTAIGGAIPSPGSLQPDIELGGLHYLHRISDSSTDTGLHIEPGLWIRVPPTEDPEVTNDTYVRQATTPHGGSFLAQNTFAAAFETEPTIGPVDSTPFTGTIPGLNDRAETPLTDRSYLAPYSRSQLPPGLAAGVTAADVISNPALLLAEELVDQYISHTTVIQISTSRVGGIVNIPFVSLNANAVQLDAIYWLETVEHPTMGQFLQLQYLQRVILEYYAVKWPHISVATLRKQ
jgi:hypothetical protein